MKIVSLVSLILFPFIGFSQVILLDQNDSTHTCVGTFYDSGAGSANYADNEDFTYTICPNGAGLKTEITFQEFALDPTDTLCIYDGDDVASGILLGCYTETSIAVGTVFTSNQGCLTFVMHSDGSGTGPGFIGQLACANCQTIIPKVTTNPPHDPSTLYADICPGEVLQVEAATLYPEDGTNYDQDDATSTFYYSMSGITSNTADFPIVVNSEGYYPVNLTVTDVNGCENTQTILIVRVAPEPVFAGTGIDVLNTYCVGDTLSLYGYAETPYVSYSYSNVGNDTTYLEDFVGGTYDAPLNVGGLGLGATVSSISDIESICVNMEHSWAGDLEITLICPSGVEVTLQNYDFTGIAMLGEPINIDDPTLIGVGWDYCWENSNPNGDWYTYANDNGLTTSDQLPAGTYQSYEVFSDLIGCPLNGEWILQIEDNWGADDGFVFGWSIQFNAALYQDSIGFQTEITDSWWQYPAGTNIGPDTMEYYIIENGANDYHYVVLDNFGCTWDTTINIQAAPTPEAIISAENECTHTQPFTFNNVSTNVVSPVYTWNLGDGTITNTTSPVHSYASAGVYTVSLMVNNTNGCKDDTIIQVSLFEAPIAAFEQDLEIRCDSLLLSFTNQSTETPAYRWYLDGNLVSTERDFSVVLPYEAIYTIQMVAANGVCNRAAGLVDTLGKFSDYYSLLIPNVFTPNNDKMNDTFSIKDGLALAECTQYEIFNRWGKVIFESSDDRPIWDGKDKDGTLFADGTYMYVITFKKKKYSGDFTLLK